MYFNQFFQSNFLSSMMRFDDKVGFVLGISSDNQDAIVTVESEKCGSAYHCHVKY